MAERTRKRGETSVSHLFESARVFWTGGPRDSERRLAIGDGGTILEVEENDYNYSPWELTKDFVLLYSIIRKLTLQVAMIS